MGLEAGRFGVGVGTGVSGVLASHFSAASRRLVQ